MKATRAEIGQRIDTIFDWLVEGKKPRQIMQDCATQWGIRPRQARNYINRAEALLVEAGKRRREVELGKAAARLDELYSEARKGGSKNPWLALHVLDRQMTLFGLAEAQRVVVEDWRTEAIRDIRAGKLTYEALAAAFDDSLATELFRTAGIPVQAGTGAAPVRHEEHRTDGV